MVLSKALLAASRRPGLRRAVVRLPVTRRVVDRFVAGETLADVLGVIRTLTGRGIDVTVDKQTHITVTGADRQLVGQVAANIRRLRQPDPYKQKGVRYTGEVLKKKVGKTGA